MCGRASRQKKHRSFIQRLKQFGIKSRKATPSLYSVHNNDTASITSTIRRLPTVPTLLSTPRMSAPTLLHLSVTMKCDVKNIDAIRGGECTVLTTLSTEYTLPPSTDRTSGFDGVLCVDIGMSREKVALARECVFTIVETTGSNDRLGLVTFGEEDSTTVVSELIMCTSSYKQALQNFVRDLKPTNPGQLDAAMRLALGLLGSDARYGGHIFVISDGNCIPISITPFWSRSLTTVHTVAVGGLVQTTLLGKIRTREGCMVELRDAERDVGRLALLVGYLATNIRSQPIETVRCRFSFPEDKISILETSTHPSYRTDSSSITISPPSISASAIFPYYFHLWS